MSISKCIVSEIFADISFTEAEVKNIEKKFKKLSFKKGSTLITPNKSINHQYFVQSGCLRSFYIDENCKEHTIQFAINNWWISDYTSLFCNAKSILNVEVLENAIIYELSKENMNILCNLYPNIANFFRKKLEIAFASFQKRILNNSVNDAETRYISFIKNYPEIEKNVKNYHIASYLGITSESLSRIRKNLKF